MAAIYPNSAVSSSDFALADEPPDRETAEGWAQWRRSRRSFVAAPLLDLRTYRALSPRDKAFHDLHRRATHANLPMLETPMSATVSRLLHSRMQTNSLNAGPSTRPGVMINGGGNQGKTETTAEAAASFEEMWLHLRQRCDPEPLPGVRDLRCTVAYVQTPVKATPKATCESILDFFGDHISRSATLTQLIRQVRTSLRDHRTRVLILDDITRLKMHRIDDQDTLDLLRSLMSMRVTLILVGVGIPKSGLLRGAQRDATGQWAFEPYAPDADWADDETTQTERRFDLADLEPFRYGTPEDIAHFVTHLAGLEGQLRLFNARPGMLTEGIMPEYIYRRTGGVVGYIERLLGDGAALAMDTGTEEINEGVLDRVLIRAGGPRRDAASGEEGDVPPQPASVKGKRKPRNKVLDDPGVPASSTAVT